MQVYPSVPLLPAAREGGKVGCDLGHTHPPRRVIQFESDGMLQSAFHRRGRGGCEWSLVGWDTEGWAQAKVPTPPLS